MESQAAERALKQASIEGAEYVEKLKQGLQWAEKHDLKIMATNDRPFPEDNQTECCAVGACLLSTFNYPFASYRYDLRFPGATMAVSYCGGDLRAWARIMEANDGLRILQRKTQDDL